MAKGLASSIRELVNDKGVSEDVIKKIIEEFLLAAYKQAFGSIENAVVRFIEDDNGDVEEVSLYSRKMIVDTAYKEYLEIELEDAKELVEDCEIGDELEIEIDLTKLNRKAVMVASQKATQLLSEIQKDKNFRHYSENLNELVVGYYQREKDGDIYLDLGNNVEGRLPRSFQLPSDAYSQGDRVRTVIHEVKKNEKNNFLGITLSRSHSEFVQRLFDLEVPEIKEDVVVIEKIVRDPGYRTKMAVWSKKTDVDPVGACVGLRGSRILNVAKELGGEKIDILHYDPDPKEYIRNALSPAEVKWVILDESKRSALAVVEVDQLPFAVGKSGQNVRLASRLVDWNIDVKTTEDYSTMEISEDNKRAMDALFSNEESFNEILTIAELPGVPVHVVMALKDAGVVQIEDLIDVQQSGRLASIAGLSEDDIKLVTQIIEENVDIVDDEGNSIQEEYVSPAGATEEEVAQEETVEDTEEEIEYYECPECGGNITLDMEACPSCGVGLSFEFEEEEE